MYFPKMALELVLNVYRQRFFFVLKIFLKPEENFEKKIFSRKKAKKKKKGIFMNFSETFITSHLRI